MLKLGLFKDGKTILSGTVKWIGNVENNTEGCAICIDSGSELKIILPNDDNTQDIQFDTEKLTIKMDTTSKTKCSVCGKGLEIFDELRPAPYVMQRLMQIIW